ncbi:galactosyltransferase-related protein [uncultured Rubinisphaera sp.]|uniref:galactosyltransferase-related protein n=1 Tax=uncultured Rubinisphaera sp. TaxID=1678686 RepID=UPI0030DA289E
MKTYWLARSEMRTRTTAGRLFFESPSLIGCCFAMHRDLYAEILGMDSDMQQWGVEDLDLGMKAWLFDAPVLTDAEVVIGHRFRRTFDNFTVEHAHILANELRFARKHFEDRAWKQWLNARRSSMPVNAWQAGWDLYETNLASIEAQKKSLQSRRVHDEYWYAEQFGLNWPGRDAESVPRGLAMMQMSGGNPSEMPSPEPSVEPSEGPSSSAGSSFSGGSYSSSSHGDGSSNSNEGSNTSDTPSGSSNGRSNSSNSSNTSNFSSTGSQSDSTSSSNNGSSGTTASSAENLSETSSAGSDPTGSEPDPDPSSTSEDFEPSGGTNSSSSSVTGCGPGQVPEATCDFVVALNKSITIPAENGLLVGETGNNLTTEIRFGCDHGDIAINSDGSFTYESTSSPESLPFLEGFEDSFSYYVVENGQYHMRHTHIYVVNMCSSPLIPSEIVDVELQLDYDHQHIPAVKADEIVSLGGYKETKNFGTSQIDAISYRTDFGIFVLKGDWTLLPGTSGIKKWQMPTEYYLVGVAHTSMSSQAVRDALVFAKYEQESADFNVMLLETAVSLVPFVRSADLYNQGKHIEAAMELVGDLLSFAVPVGRLAGAGAKTLAFAGGVEVTWEAGLAANNVRGAIANFWQGNVAAGQQNAIEALLRIFGIAGVYLSSRTLYKVPDDDIGFIARRGTPGRVVNGTAIIGTAQVTTQRHAEAIEELAEYLAKTGEFHYITMNRSWRTSTGMTDKFPWGLGSRKPDLIAVDKRGKVHAYEFESGSDIPGDLKFRLDEKVYNSHLKEEVSVK